MEMVALDRALSTVKYNFLMHSSSPVIGITLDSQERGEYSDHPYYILRHHYTTAFSRYGALPIMLPYTSPEHYINMIDGLVITGGDFDIDPSLYNEEKQLHLITNDARTNFEASILRLAMVMQKPILGICGGAQLINVLAGGTLHQHIPDEIDTDINHEQEIPKHLPSHIVEVRPNTLLSRMLGEQKFVVNSTHHQAIKTLGNGIVISAIAPDGVIEAIESETLPFCLGLQWHPEYLTTDEDCLIFKIFTEHCREHKTKDR